MTKGITIVRNAQVKCHNMKIKVEIAFREVPKASETLRVRFAKFKEKSLENEFAALYVRAREAVGPIKKISKTYAP